MINRIASLLSALLFVALGIWLILDPHAITTFYAISLNDPMAVSEMRAVFGGMMLGIGALVLWLDLGLGRRIDAADCMLLVFGALLIARVVGLIADGIPSGPVRNEALIELAMFSILLLTRHRGRGES